MKNTWEKIKNFFSRIWHGLTRIGRILLGLIIIATIVLVVFLTTEDTNDGETENSDNAPEITQVYEPSIGTPLPPDNPGAVSGASTTEPSTTELSTDQSVSSFEAPKSGIDPNEPVAYVNNNFKFTATLPAETEVQEETTRTIFTSKTSSLRYIVSVNQSSENLDIVESQLRNSPTASNISQTTFNNTQALKFTAKGYGSGIVFVSNGQIYYLLGDYNYFSTFKLL